MSQPDLLGLKIQAARGTALEHDRLGTEFYMLAAER